MFFSGAFYTELNEAIVLSAIKIPGRISRVMVTVPAETTMADDRASNASHQLAIKKLLQSYEMVSVCNGEFVAFVIAWNLIMEYMVIVALISKALIIFFDAMFFDSVGQFNQVIPISWHFSQHFDVIALFVPIIIGGKRKMSYKNSFDLHFLRFYFSMD